MSEAMVKNQSIYTHQVSYVSEETDSSKPQQSPDKDHVSPSQARLVRALETLKSRKVRIRLPCNLSVEQSKTYYYGRSEPTTSSSTTTTTKTTTYARQKHHVSLDISSQINNDARNSLKRRKVHINLQDNLQCTTRVNAHRQGRTAPSAVKQVQRNITCTLDSLVRLIAALETLREQEGRHQPRRYTMKWAKNN